VTIDVFVSAPAPKKLVGMRTFSVGCVPIASDERFYIDIKGEKLYWLCRWQPDPSVAET
jgi:hypothetical protein